jgi:two-component system NtrC family sensor kinase
VCELVATIARKGSVTLVPPPHDEDLLAPADDGQLTQVLANLAVNAIQATPPGGRVTISARVVCAAPPPYVGGAERSFMAIEVRDTGAGMDEATRSRVFEPFYTTKEVGDGTGLGLSVSWGIVREHGGWIDVASSPGAGAAFTVYLPRGAA